jgi:hypothetical protein
MNTGKVSCLNSTDHLHLFAWSHVLLLTRFWHVYIFRLYVYIYLYSCWRVFDAFTSFVYMFTSICTVLTRFATYNGDHETATPTPSSLEHEMKGWLSMLSTDVSSPAPLSSLTSPCSWVDLFSCFLILFCIILYVFTNGWSTAASLCSQGVNDSFKISIV